MAKQKTSASSTSIRWDYGTAYELFTSLHVIHSPNYFGIRASWAAGVRSRIPPTERKILDEVFTILGVPLKWLSTLPDPKDAVTALLTLRQMPPAERLIRIYNLNDKSSYHSKSEDDMKLYPEASKALIRISETKTWTQKDLVLFTNVFGHKGEKLKKDQIERYLDWWSKPEELGEGFLNALQSYYQAFFEAEEKRVAPVLKESLAHAKQLAKKLSIDELFSELSQGVQLGDDFRTPNLVIAPAYWITPLIFFDRIDKDTTLLLFGARPASMSVIPGEMIPDGLVRTLKSLGDPTRLKILNYLSHEELTPSELARRLHLRAPTVTHHLSELRLSGLVNLTFVGHEKRYTTRAEALNLMCTALKDFLKSTSAQ